MIQFQPIQAHVLARSTQQGTGAHVVDEVHGVVQVDTHQFAIKEK